MVSAPVAQRTIPLGGRAADGCSDLVRGGSTRRVIGRLFTERHFVQDMSTLTDRRVVDPFLAAWQHDA